MLTLPILAQMSSAAVAAALTASLTYGHYSVASGADGSGLMPPASILRPGAPPDALIDPVGEIAHALAAMQLGEAKLERNKAMVDWLASLPAQDGAPAFSVQRLEAGLVYAVRYAPAGGQSDVLQDLVAVPYGPEMPFAISLRSGPDHSVAVEGTSCKGSEPLGVVSLEAGPDAAEAEALSHAEAYLAAPDAADPGLPADCLMQRLKRR